MFAHDIFYYFAESVVNITLFNLFCSVCLLDPNSTVFFFLFCSDQTKNKKRLSLLLLPRPNHPSSAITILSQPLYIVQSAPTVHSLFPYNKSKNNKAFSVFVFFSYIVPLSFVPRVEVSTRRARTAQSFIHIIMSLIGTTP